MHRTTDTATLSWEGLENTTADYDDCRLGKQYHTAHDKRTKAARRPVLGQLAIKGSGNRPGARQSSRYFITSGNFDPRVRKDVHGNFEFLQPGSQSKAGEESVETVCHRLTAVIGDVLWSCDKEFSITFLSDSIKRLLGYDAQEFCRKPLEDHFTQRFSKKIRAFKRYLNSRQSRNCRKRTVSYTFEMLTKDGKEIWVETDVVPLRQDSLEIIGYTGTLRDVTARVKQETVLRNKLAEAETASKAKSAFLSGLNHEMRTPINGVLGILHLLENTELTGGQQELLGSAVQSGNNLLHLISDVLDLAKIEAGKAELKSTESDLRDLLESTVDASKGLLSSSQLELRWLVDDTVPQRLLLDTGRLRQILLNLISNSIKHTDKGNVTILVSSEVIDKDRVKLLFTVEDSGSGISEELVPQLFNQFVQAEESQCKTFHSSGLGLSIVKQFVEFMGGSVSLKSSKGIGTVVHFDIMAKTANTITAEPVSQPSQPVLTQNPLHLLVVEDDSTNILVASSMLKLMGHTVSCVGSGQEALWKLRQQEFDCILMDIQMPGMDGVETSQAIRSDLSVLQTDIPIIALTAHTMKGDREYFLASGMDGYLTKPLQVGVLQQELMKVLSK